MSANRLTIRQATLFLVVLVVCSGQYACPMPWFGNAGPPSGSDNGDSGTGGVTSTEGLDLCPDDPSKNAPFVMRMRDSRDVLRA